MADSIKDFDKIFYRNILPGLALFCTIALTISEEVAPNSYANSYDERIQRFLKAIGGAKYKENLGIDSRPDFTAMKYNNNYFKIAFELRKGIFLIIREVAKGAGTIARAFKEVLTLLEHTEMTYVGSLSDVLTMSERDCKGHTMMLAERAFLRSIPEKDVPFVRFLYRKQDVSRFISTK